jgi:hypothetical protein
LPLSHFFHLLHVRLVSLVPLRSLFLLASRYPLCSFRCNIGCSLKTRLVVPDSGNLLCCLPFGFCAFCLFLYTIIGFLIRILIALICFICLL